MRKYQILIYSILLVTIGLLDILVIQNESVRMGIYSGAFFIIIMGDRLIRRNPWCKNVMILELSIAFIYLGIAGGLIFGPDTVYFMEFSFVILIGLFLGILKKQTVSYFNRMNFFENVHNALSEKKAQDMRLYSQDKRLAIGLHFVILMLYFLVLFLYSNFWILLLFAFVLTLESFFMMDNSKYFAIIVQEKVLFFNKSEKLWVSITRLEFRKDEFVMEKRKFRRAKCLEREFFPINSK